MTQGFWRKGKPMFCRYNVTSYAMARLKGDTFNHYRTNAPRAQPHQIKTEEDLRAMLAPGGKRHYLVAPHDEVDKVGT
ncbi:MAG: hypothetical protein Q8M31_17105 [Beijerinckiaceae bacterium]|nr:hypothetical protein [Beijerinckiaceae bacterium]